MSLDRVTHAGGHLRILALSHFGPVPTHSVHPDPDGGPDPDSSAPRENALQIKKKATEQIIHDTSLQGTVPAALSPATVNEVSFERFAICFASSSGSCGGVPNEVMRTERTLACQILNALLPYRFGFRYVPVARENWGRSGSASESISPDVVRGPSAASEQ